MSKVIPEYDKTQKKCASRVKMMFYPQELGS